MENSRTLVSKVWDSLCSLRLTLFVLIFLASTSVVGTVIPQAPSIPKEYLQSLSQNKLRLYEKLGFFDMYHSWWFLLLLSLLTVNLIACSIKRLPRVWKTVTEPVLTMDHSFERSLANSHEMPMSGDAVSLKNRLVPFLASEFARSVITEESGSFHLFAERKPWCRLGVYVVHTSIVIIFVGAIIGSVYGFKGFVQIEEGTSVTSARSYDGKEIPLGFSLLCDKFSASFYDTGAPKEFKSLLTVQDKGTTVIEKRAVIVNDPLSYKGFTFYQSSYGPAGEQNFYLTTKDSDGKPVQKITIHEQCEPVSLPDGSAIRLMEHTDEIRPYMPQYSGPAARLEIVPTKGEKYYAVVLKNHPDYDLQRKGTFVFTYDGVGSPKMYTGLQVARDPGVWVVWAGCALMVVGIFMAFFLSHQRIWIRISDNRVAIGGNASKNPAAFQAFFNDLVDKLKKF